LRALAAAGVAVPMLEDEPHLSTWQELAFVAWRDLCGERQFGMSAGPIPWRAIVAWVDRYEVRDAEFFIELVQTIDAEWLNDGPAKTENQARAAGAHRQVRLGAAPVPGR
jgi:hypothetical protein